MPTRSCIICRKKQEKNTLFRVISKDEDVIFDRLQNINSRAIYFCKNRDCLQRAKTLIEKGKIKSKIKINFDKLNIVLDELKNELGE